MNYDKTFVVVIKFMNYKLLFALTVIFNLKIEQMNVKTAFLYS